MDERKGLLRELLPHAIWKAIEWTGDKLIEKIAGAGVIAAGVALIARLRNHLDFVTIAAVFVLSVAVLVFAGRRNRTPVEHKTKGHRLPTCKATTTEEWTQAGATLEAVVNQTFKYLEVKIDGRNFIGCSFTHVSLFYDGTLPFGFDNCQFDSDTTTHFHTHNPAMAQWTELLRTLGMLKPDLAFVVQPENENPGTTA